MTDPLILTINFGFLYFLIILTSIFIALKFSTKMNSVEKENYNIVKKTGYVIVPVVAGIMVSILAVNTIFQTQPVENGDISNWTTLIVEIGIGVIIGLTIFIYSDREQKKTKAILQEQVNKSKKRQYYVIKQIQYKFSFASDVSPRIDKLQKLLLVQDDEKRNSEFEEELHNLPYVIDELKNIQNLTNLYAEDIEPDDLKLILKVAKNAQKLSNILDYEQKFIVEHLENFQDECAEFFEKYPHIDWDLNQEEALD